MAPSAIKTRRTKIAKANPMIEDKNIVMEVNYARSTFVPPVIAPTSYWQLIKSKHDPVLAVLYVLTTLLCISMVFWILISPASWMIDKSKFHRETLLPLFDRLGFFRLVPSTLVTKFQHHPAVHFTHLLPGAVWASIIPFQLHPTWRQSHRQLHRILGYVFTAASLLMTLGVAIMVKRNLTFVNSFPSIPPADHSFDPHFHVSIILLWTLWFAMTIIQGVRMTRRNYHLHQRWILRHVASGIWISAQRFLFVPFYMASQSMAHPEGIPPWIQRKSFGDTGIRAWIFCIILGEYAIDRLHKLQGGAESETQIH